MRTSPRNAKLAPRATIPSAATLSGTNNVVKMAAKAAGKPVQSTTSAMISQTWLDSHTGVMDRSMRCLGAAPRAADPASRSQIPPPKSAPASAAYAVLTTTSTAATMSAITVPAPAGGPAAAWAGTSGSGDPCHCRFITQRIPKVATVSVP